MPWQVDQLRSEVQASLSEAYETLRGLSLEHGDPAAKQPCCVHDRVNEAVWLMLPKGCSLVGAFLS